MVIDMQWMKKTEKEVLGLFEESKLISDNFTNFSKLLKELPQSVLIIRLASGLGQPKFSKATGITESNTWSIENKKVGLGKLGLKKIENFLQSSDLDFTWPNIKKFFDMFNSGMGDRRSGSTRFDKLSLDELRKISIKGLKARELSESEQVLNEILKELEICFESQASLSVFEKTNRLNIIDFAIPDGISPKVLIEVTSGKIERDTEGQFLNNIGNKKLIEGLRIKRFLPNVKLFLFATGKIDEFSKNMLLESFDVVFLKDDADKLKENIKGLLNA